MMPRLDGWEANRALNQHPETADIPLLLVTAFGNDVVDGEPKKQGFIGMLQKPIAPKQLVREIAQVIGEPTEPETT